MNGNYREPVPHETSPAKTTACENLGMEKRPLTEKVWWVIGFVICISGLSYSIYMIVEDFQKSPVLVTTDHTTTPIYMIPFPAVTVCPDSKIQSKLLNYTETTKKLRRYSKLKVDKRPTKQSIKNFEVISHICNHRHILSTEKSLWKGKPFMNKSDVHRIFDLAPDFNEMFLACKWDKETNCAKIFTPIITAAGRCYTFNMVTEIFRNAEIQNDYLYFGANTTQKHWNFDEGYTSDAIDDAYPKRAMGIGRRRGLSLTLRSYDNNLNYLCRNGDQGYKIILHNPTEFPQPLKHFVRVPHGQDAQFAITPKSIKNDDSINSYSPERRKCFFNHEHYLTFFRTYNQMNCQLECVANVTYVACGCVNFPLPRGRGIPICGPEKIGCYAPIWSDWENEMLLNDFKAMYNGSRSVSVESGAINKCKCLPECTMVHYANEHEFVRYNIDDEIDEFPELREKYSDGSNRSYQITKINIRFTSTKFYGETRSEIYPISDLVANFGGLLGLFVGGSFLSLVELIYFYTIRNLCKYRCGSGNSDVA